MQTLEYARYTYPQHEIDTYTNASFFIGSPRLYRLLSDPRFTRLGTKADVPQGISTGQNSYYIRRTVAGEGYQAVDQAKVLSDGEIAQLTESEKRSHGVAPASKGGRHFIPFDKGGESEANDGWMPNYSVPTAFFIGNYSGRSQFRQKGVAREDGAQAIE